jgi:N-terminal acetyltransferase B complex non-catalytic subunit
LDFLIEIYKHQNQRDEILKLLNSRELGCDSAIVKGDWAIVRAKLAILEEQRRYEEIHRLCSTVLQRARPKLPDVAEEPSEVPSSNAYGDDWRIWEALIDVTERIDTDE